MQKLSYLFLSLLIISVFTVTAMAQTTEPQKKMNVAILLFDGVQIIDYTGPYEVFGAARMNVYTVAEKPQAITTAYGMNVTPKYSFDNYPKPDILMIPGGGVDPSLENPNVIKWVQDNAKNAKYVLSVCNGAFILAKAGLLDNLEATTTATRINLLREFSPKTKMITDKRVVDNGKFISSGGLSAGIEGALHVVSKIDGEGTAQAIAVGLEYHWDRNSTFLPGTLARKYLFYPRGFMYSFNSLVRNANGDKDRWEESFTVTEAASAEDVLKQINNNLSTQAKWTNSRSADQDTKTSLWQFKDENGKDWNAKVSIENAAGGEPNALIVTFKLARRS